MAFDEDLANRIRELIAGEDGYTEQKMFGGIGLMIHCPKEETEALLAKAGAFPFEMRGREMNGWLRVEADSVRPSVGSSRGSEAALPSPAHCRRSRNELERRRCL
jgi:hypothetical protein